MKRERDVWHCATEGHGPWVQPARRMANKEPGPEMCERCGARRDEIETEGETK